MERSKRIRKKETLNMNLLKIKYYYWLFCLAIFCFFFVCKKSSLKYHIECSISRS